MSRSPQRDDYDLHRACDKKLALYRHTSGWTLELTLTWLPWTRDFLCREQWKKMLLRSIADPLWRLQKSIARRRWPSLAGSKVIFDFWDHVGTLTILIHKPSTLVWLMAIVLTYTAFRRSNLTQQTDIVTPSQKSPFVV